MKSSDVAKLLIIGAMIYYASNPVVLGGLFWLLLLVFFLWL